MKAEILWALDGPQATLGHPRPRVPKYQPEVFDGQRSPEVPQDLQQNPGPVAPVAQLPQIGQRLLWRAHRVLQLGQLVT